MIVKRIGSGGARNAVDTTKYISDGKNADDAGRPEELAGHGPKVVAAGTVNVAAEKWHDAAREIASLETLYKGTGHATDHLVLSWQADERPTKQQMAEAVAVALRHAGYENQPAVWTAHGDTQNLHVHIAVSRITLDRVGQAKIIDGAATVRSKNGDNIVESLHVSAAEICRQGWRPEPDARYGPDLKRIKKQRDPNSLNLSQKIKDSEAITGKEHPSHTLALVAVPILRSAKTWPEAKEKLAVAGIQIEIKALKNGGQGAVLSTPLGARAKLSSLPADCSLKNLNKKYSVLGPSLADSRPGPSPSPQAAIKLAEATAKRKAQPKRDWTPAQVKNQAKRILSDSVSWGDALRDFKREGWQLERAGKSGALLVVKTGDAARPEIRVKMSDIPGRGNSYGKLSERFGNTAEEALQNGDVSKADFDAVVSYPERAQNPVTQAVTNQGTQDDPNAIRLPSSILDDERLTGQPSALRRMAETAVQTIRESKAQGINGLASDLATKGIEMRPALTRDGQMVGIRLVSPGVQGSISLAALPRDCRMSALAQRFGETYRHRPDRFRPNSRADGKPVGTLVQINPEDDALEIIKKTLEAIAQDLAAGGQPASWDRDTRPITLVRPKPADPDAALDHRVPLDLPREQAQTWKVQEQIKGIFRGALEKINAKKAEDPDAARLGWKFVEEELDRRGWRLEMNERDFQVVDRDGEAHRLADIEISAQALVRAWGEPEAPLVPIDGETPEQTAVRREQVVYDRHMRIEAGDAARLLREPLDMETLLARVEARGWRLEDTVQSVRVVLDDKTAVDVSRLKIEPMDIFDRLDGRRLPIAGWREMDAEQRKSAIERIELREALRAKSWEAVLERLERRGARIELTGGGQGKASTGGRVALADGRKIPLSAMGPGLAQLNKRKTGNITELVKSREQARKAKAAPAPAPAPTPKSSQKAQDDARKSADAEKRAEAFRILKELQDREKQENKQKQEDADARAAKNQAVRQAPTPQAAKAAQATKLKTDQNQQLKAQEQSKAKARTQDQQTQARTQTEQREKERLEKERKEREREKERLAREAMDRIRSNDAFKPIRSNASSEVDNLTKMLHENSAQEQRNTLERLQHEARQQQLQQEGMKHG